MAKDLMKKEQAEFEMFDEGDSAGQDMDREDIVIPRLTILQSNSPQTQKRESTYVEGCEPGMIFDVVNNVGFDGEDGVVIVPLNFRKTYIEWISREQGGGFVADHGNEVGKALLADCTKDDTKDILPNGNQLVRTLEYVCFQIKENGFYPTIISMASSQIKHGLRFNTQLSTYSLNAPDGQRKPAPIYFRAWDFKTQPESNDKGSWFSWMIQAKCKITDLPGQVDWLKDPADFIAECKEFRKLVQSDAIRFAPPPAATTEGDSESY